MAQDNAFSVGGVALRISRLAADGTLVKGASAAYVTKKFVSINFTPEYEAGDEFTTKNAAGTICATWKQPDSLKRITLSLEVCDPDTELHQILAGGQLLSKNGRSVGWASPQVGEDATPNGVAIEAWSYAGLDGKRAGQDPYWRWVFPYAQVRPSGERALQNGIMAVNFEGWGVGNTGFGTGPDTTDPWSYASDRPYQYVRTSTVPAGQGFVTVT